MIFRILFLPLLLCFTISLSAQNYISSVTKYDQKDGLSHNQIDWIHKDSRGMIWVGAVNGINRYDGKEFKLIAPIDFYRTKYQYIMEDHEGDLWIKKNVSPSEELIFFNTISGKLKTFEEKFKTPVPFNKTNYYKSIQLSDGSMIIGTSTDHSSDAGKLIFCDSNFNCIVKMEYFNSEVLPFKNSQSDHFWVESKKAIHDYLRNPSLVNLLKFNPEKELQLQLELEIPSPEYAVLNGAVTRNNNFLFHTFKYLLEIDENGSIDSTAHSKLTSGLYPSLQPNYSDYDTERELFWYNNYSSLFVYKKTGASLPLGPNAQDLAGASEYFGGYVDGDQYWLGSIDGLYKFYLKKSPFNKVLYQSEKKTNQEFFNSCRGIDSDSEGNVYVAGKHGIFSLDNPNKKLIPDLTHLLEIMYDDRGYLWVGKRDNEEIIRYNLKTGKQKIYRLPKTSGIYEDIWSLYLDKNKRLWIGLGEYSRVHYLDDGAEEIQTLGGYTGLSDFSQTFVYDFFEDNEEQIWLLRSNGLYLFDIEKGIGERFSTDEDPTHYIPSSDLRHMHQDEEGYYWIASSDGLIWWDKANQKSRIYTTEDGLSHNHIYAVYEDEFGFLWMSSDNGIMQFQKSTGKVKTFFPSDGITHREFNRISHHQNPDGTIYFGGLNGVTYFHPKYFIDDFDKQPDIPIVLTDCQLYSGKTKQQESRLDFFNRNGEIIMAPGDQYLKLDFALLDYKNSESIKYAYAINDEQNLNMTKDNTINIGALPYGKHILTIKGKNGNGLFSKQELQIPITVLKPFYLQTWFIILSLLSGAFLIFVYQKNKTRALVQRQKELEDTVQERTKTIADQKEVLLHMDKTKSRFLTNISHELRTPLTLVLNSTESLEDKLDKTTSDRLKKILNNDFSILKRNSHRLQTLIEQLLDLSKLENGKLSLQVAPFSINHYLTELSKSFVPLAEKKNIAIIPFQNVEEIELYFDRDKMDKIFYNLLFNAIKFTPANGSITISLQQLANEVQIQIQDTGIGIVPEDLPHIFERFYQVKQADEYAHEGTGIGLALVKELTELHKGSVNVESILNQGTCFTLSFPLGKFHFHENEISPILTKLSPTKINKIGEELIDENSTESSEIKEETNKKPILLFIEDNEDLRFYLHQQFNEKYNIIQAADGHEGLELAYQHIPDIIISDVMMPEKNGYEVCHILKNDERTDHIPIILLTAKASHDEKIKGLSIGADTYIVKPYDPLELDLRISNLLRQIESLQQRYQTKSPEEQKEVIADPQEPKNHFILKVESIIETELTNPLFGIKELSENINLSRSQLFRKIKALTGKTPTAYLRSYRLAKAKQLLLNYAGNATEVSYMVGFNNPNYFFKCFKEEFNMTPSQMMEGVMN